MNTMPTLKSVLWTTGAVLMMVLVASGAAWADPPLPGAIFTTDSTCTGVNLNIYASKDDVYLDGGPSHPGAAGLPDGDYYVQVTEPNGTLLGTSVGSGNATPVHLTGGEFASCYRLSLILIKASDGSAGYDDTGNPGGEYKVWVSNESSFANNSTKTDNFKVKSGGEQPPQAQLHVVKFYDANVDGINDDGTEGGPTSISGWKVRIQDGIDLIRFTPVDVIVDPDDYTVTEVSPAETNWIATTANPVAVTLADGDDETVEFGNVCVGPGGGLTLGFWSNKNGQALFGADDLALMVSLNLRDGAGNAFDPVSYSQFRSWLLSATATNMAYMLSAQFAAMELNVLNGKVGSGALVYAPGCGDTGVGGNFRHVDSLMSAADLLLVNPLTTEANDPVNRAAQECLKNALDAANNSKNFVQSMPCPFTFPE
jgi:hypothetical protein